MLASKRISIIIPVFNVEKYISACLESVFCQDIPEDEYEVICVNDGSTDGSRSIVEEFLKTHSNLKLIDHPRNLKLGVARNTGRKFASGTYIWNVDSDDMIAPNCLKEILEICEEQNLDVLEFGYFNYRSEKNCDSASKGEIPRDSHVYTGPQFLEKYHLNNIGSICGIWRKVCKKAFLDSNNIYSPPINMGEDEPFAISIFAWAERMAYLDRVCYYYRRSDVSLSGEPKNNWSADRWYEASMVCSGYMNKSLQMVEKQYSSKGLKVISDMITYDISYWINYDIPEKERGNFWRLCRKNFWKNLFVFCYLGKKSSLKYLWRMASV